MAIASGIVTTGSFVLGCREPVLTDLCMLAAPNALKVHYEEPVERAFGDVHDKCTRNHARKRIWHLVQDVPQHLRVNGPWRYALSEIYYTPEVTAAVATLQAARSTPVEISPLAA